MAAKPKPAKAAKAAAGRGRVPVKNPAAAARQDLAETRGRLKAARTPVSKAVLGQLMAGKERTYSGQAARGHTRAARRATGGSAAKRR